MKPLVLYDVEHGIAMEPMKWKWASSRVDLGNTELFCISEVTAVFLSRAHRDMRAPVQMTLSPTAFSRVSTRDSGMSSSCEMKDEPEFTPLQGNRAFF